MFDLKPKEPAETISFRIPKSLLNNITGIMEARGVNRTQVLIASIGAGLQALKSPAASTTTGL